MGKYLLIVESPSKAKTIKKYLGKDYEVKATIGHIKDLPEDELGVDVAADFALDYKTIKGKAKVVAELKKAAAGTEIIYVGSDPDREGEAIAWHVAEELGKGKNAPEVKRVLFHEITKTGILRAMNEPGELNVQKYESQKARRTLDRLVGYQISPILWKKVRRGLSAGRVQSVAVGFIVDRENEVTAFVPREFWTVKAQLATAEKRDFEASLVDIGDGKADLPTGTEALPLAERLRNSPWKVETVEQKAKRRSPQPPFITSRLQQEASRLYHFTAKRTMALAQQLYEGVELGPEGPVGLITYMRTDSTRVAPEAAEEARIFVTARYGKEFLPGAPNEYRNRKSAQDAHEAIRPTSVMRTPEAVGSFLDPDQLRLYTLIWKRFVASQMEAAVYDVTTAMIEAGGCRFRASGSVQRFAGYRQVYQEQLGDDDKAEVGSDLPDLQAGQPLDLKDLQAIQNFTQPPPRYTEASLIRVLEEKGIGRPSTYASIISTIQDRQYVLKVEGRFRPSELGALITGLLRDSFPTIMDVEFTARMEENLDLVEEGKTSSLEVMRAFWEPFRLNLDSASQTMKNLKAQPMLTEIPCSVCGKPMAIRFGRNGEFLACSAFPECRNTINFSRDPQGNVVPEKREESGEHCPEHGKELIRRNGRFGPFLACPDYPACKFTKPLPSGLVCPKVGCGGSLVERKSKKGNSFHRCDKCELVLFGRIKKEPCPTCGNPFLEEKGRGRTSTVACPNPDCGWVRE
jgi:DNA topoisomerase-1